jgi:hypothetical protein
MLKLIRSKCRGDEKKYQKVKENMRFTVGRSVQVYGWQPLASLASFWLHPIIRYSQDPRNLSLFSTKRQKLICHVTPSQAADLIFFKK